MTNNINWTPEDMAEIILDAPDDFLKVQETLTRIGVATPDGKTLYQSCHILHKRGKYYIVHFKELFALDGVGKSLSEDDIARRNTITTLLADWGLVMICHPERLIPKAPMKEIKVIPYKEKDKWNLRVKYQIGVKKNYEAS